MATDFQNYHLGTKAVILDTKGRIFLVRLNPSRMAIEPRDDYWDFPGGRVAKGETGELSLQRRLKSEIGQEAKILEDLGLIISNVEVNDPTVGSAKLILQIFICGVDSPEKIKASDEFAESGWMEPQKAAELLRVKYPANFAERFISPGRIESHSGKIVQVVLDRVFVNKDGKSIPKVFEMARRSPGTRLLIISPEGKLLLTKEFRRELNGYDYRLPGGKVFDSLDDYLEFSRSNKDITQVVIQAAGKEAREEVGINPKTVTIFHKSVAGATVEWDLYYVIVEDFESLPSQQLESGEDIQPTWVSFDEASEIALSGKMSEDRSVAVLLRYLKNKR